MAGAADFIGFLAVLLVALELQGPIFRLPGRSTVVLASMPSFLGQAGRQRRRGGEQAISRNDAFMCSVLG